jgi:urea carboxylase-associated protein 2
VSVNIPELLWEERLEPGASWSHVLKRGSILRITDLDGGANVGAIFYNFECTAERFNMPDTLKAQHIARITSGCALYSDMGRVLCSIPADTVGWHDPLGGCSNAALVREKYGEAPYQEHRNQCHRNGLESFLIEIGKWGLSPRDLMANINFFSRVDVDAAGGMSFHECNSKAGDSVDLRAEMNVLTVLHSCPHPLDPAPRYRPRPALLSIWRSSPAGPDDPCRLSRPENERGFTLTERYFL